MNHASIRRGQIKVAFGDQKRVEITGGKMKKRTIWRRIEERRDCNGGEEGKEVLFFRFDFRCKKKNYGSDRERRMEREHAREKRKKRIKCMHDTWTHEHTRRLNQSNTQRLEEERDRKWKTLTFYLGLGLRFLFLFIDMII